MKTEKHETISIGLFGMSLTISIIFAVLKLLNLWNISWFWVCFPMILVGSLIVLILLVFFIVMIVLLIRLLLN